MVYASTSKASLFAIAVASLPAFVRADASDASFPYNQQPSQPWQGEQIGTNDCVNVSSRASSVGSVVEWHLILTCSSSCEPGIRTIESNRALPDSCDQLGR